MNINMTFIGQSITFFVFVWFCWKYIWPLLMNAMQERQQTIAEGLAASERAEKDLALAQDRAGDQLRDAKQEAQQLIEQARGQASQMVEDAKNQAREEGERLHEAAKAEIDQEINRAKELLRGEVAALALAGAERVLGSSVDASKHGEILDRLAADL